MSPRGRRVGLVAACVVVAAAVMHGAVWYVVSGRLVASWPGTVAAGAREGWRIEAGPVRRGGWPWVATAEVPDLVVTRRSAGGSLVRWTAGRLELAIAPGDLHRVAVSPAGVQTLRLGDGPPVTLQAARATLWIALDDDRPAQVLIRALAIGGPDGGALHVGLVEARFTPVAMTLEARAIQPTPPLAAPFEGGASLAMRMVLNQPIPSGSSPWRSATAWRDAGGRVAIPEFTMRWGETAATGSGSGALDAGLQPRFAATLRVQGATPVLDAAARAGLLQPGPASAVRAVLQLLALARPGGSPGASPGAPVSIPVVLEDGVLSVAQFPLLRTQAMDWGPP